MSKRFRNSLWSSRVLFQRNQFKRVELLKLNLLLRTEWSLPSPTTW